MCTEKKKIKCFIKVETAGLGVGESKETRQDPVPVCHTYGAGREAAGRTTSAKAGNCLDFEELWPERPKRRELLRAFLSPLRSPGTPFPVWTVHQRRLSSQCSLEFILAAVGGKNMENIRWNIEDVGKEKGDVSEVDKVAFSVESPAQE